MGLILKCGWRSEGAVVTQNGGEHVQWCSVGGEG